MVPRSLSKLVVAAVATVGLAAAASAQAPRELRIFNWSNYIDEQVLRDIISPDEKKVITPEFIIDTVADHFDITPSDIVGSKRSSKIVFPRQIAMYLCREMLDAPLTGIGKMMGDRDHTTVMHGIEKIEKEMSAKDSVRNTVDILKKKINPSK